MGDIEVTDTLANQIALLDGLEKLTINESAMTIAGWQELGKLTIAAARPARLPTQ